MEVYLVVKRSLDYFCQHAGLLLPGSWQGLHKHVRADSALQPGCQAWAIPWPSSGLKPCTGHGLFGYV